MRGPGFLSTFLYYLVVTTFISVLALSQGQEQGLALDHLWLIAVLTGVVSGLVGSYLNSHIVLTLPIQNQAAFLKQLKGVLTTIGYEATSQIEAAIVYERSGPSKMFSGKLFVQIEPTVATISGRSTTVRKVRQQLENSPDSAP